MPMKNIHNNIQINISNDQNLNIPNEDILRAAIEIVLNHHKIDTAILDIQIVDNKQMQETNNEYRDINKPTNILSFPFEQPCDELAKQAIEYGFINLDDIDAFDYKKFLGDLVIAPQVLEKEAKEQNKKLDNHWAHIAVHGTLHLLGYDHIEDAEAEEMELLEVKLLSILNIENPYV